MSTLISGSIGSDRLFGPSCGSACIVRHGGTFPIVSRLNGAKAPAVGSLAGFSTARNSLIGFLFPLNGVGLYSI